MSLETEISQLTKAINELNAKFELLFNSQKTTPTPPPTQAQEVPTQAQEVALLPDVAKTMNHTREDLQAMCLAATKRNSANRDIIKSIMLNNFDARKSSDLADNQVDMCYAMIAEATQDD
mgnify:FL=1|jgi:hypothetical protein